MLTGLCLTANAQLKSFQKEYITQAFTHCYDIVPTGDGSYVFSGIQDVPNQNPTGLTSYITKIDCAGEPEWTKRFSGTSGLANLDHEVAAAGPDEIYLLTSQGVTGTFDLLLVKMDGDGNTMWARTYGGFGGDKPGGITVMSDGNLGLVGTTNSYGANAGSFYSDIYVLKVSSSDGSALWSATFGFDETISDGYAIIENDVGGLAVTGRMFHAPTVATWAPLIQIDANGSFIDAQFYGLGNRNTMGLGLNRSSDGGYLISGSSNILGADWFDVLQFPMVLKTDADGDLLWGRVLEGTPNTSGLGGTAYTPLDDGNTVAAAAQTYHYENTTSDPTKRMLYLLDASDGSLVNARQYNSEGGQFPRVKQDYDGGFIMSAMTDENIGSNPGQQWWSGPIINKLDENFFSGCNETDRTNQTVSHSPAFEQVELIFDEVSNGVIEGVLNAAADSFAVQLPAMDTFCEQLFEIEPNFSVPELECGQLSAFFEAEVDYPWYTINWDFGDGTTVIDIPNDTISHSYDSPGTYDVTLEVEICSNIYTVVQQVNLPEGGEDATIDPIEALCVSEPAVFLSAEDPGGTWSGSGITDPEAGIFDPAVAGVGSHVITYEQCFGSDEIEIEVLDEPIVDLGEDIVLCPGDVAELGAGSNGISFLWNNDSDEQTLEVYEAGSYWLIVSSGNCSASDTVVVTEEFLPQVSLGSDTSLCEGEVFVVMPSVADGDDYLWSNGETGNQQAVSETQLIWLEVANSCGTNSDTVFVHFAQNPIVSLTDSLTICEGDTAVVDVFQPQLTFEWNNGSVTPSIPIYDDGLFWVEVTDTLTACTSRDSLLAVLIDVPEVNLGNDTSICDGTGIELSIANVFYDEIYWSDGSVEDVRIVDQPGVYGVTAANQCGSGQDEIEVVTENCDECTVFVPNAFTPNGDGNNELFRPVFYNCELSSVSWIIFDRYGQVVFESDDLNPTWNGGHLSGSGFFQQNEIYVWKLTFHTEKGVDQKYELTGRVTLLR